MVYYYEALQSHAGCHLCYFRKLYKEKKSGYWLLYDTYVLVGFLEDRHTDNVGLSAQVKHIFLLEEVTTDF